MCKTSTKPSVFMIMPFSEDFLALFEELKQRFSDKYEFTHAGDMDNQQNIVRDIVEGLVSADVVIADVTGLNSNVFYELGLAHAMNKKVIIITQDIGELPFDIKAYRAHEYSIKFNKIPKLYEEISKCLEGAISGKMKYGNPVTDFSPESIVVDSERKEDSIADDNQTTEGNAIIEVDEISEMGFLDYLTDIEESSKAMVLSIESIGDDLDELSTAVGNTNDTLNRAKMNSKTLDSAFVRNVTRKLSIPINRFAVKMQEHTKDISVQWDRFENSYLAMLDDKRILTAESTPNIKEGITSLVNLKEAIALSNGQIEGLVESMRSCLGLERQLNKAISAAINEADHYLSMADSMISSIDRMISKSNITIEAWNNTSTNGLLE